jgi:hypothetical protein
MIFDTEKYQQTWEDIKQLAFTKLDLLKVDLLGKVAKIAGLILFALALILLVFAVISFGCLALIYALAQTLPMWASALIVTALWLLIMIGIVVFRNQLFFNPMLAAISAILFAPSDDSQQACCSPARPTAQAGEAPAPAEGKEVRHE